MMAPTVPVSQTITNTLGEALSAFLLYPGIKAAPNYPVAFQPVQNGTKQYNINNPEVLAALRQERHGEWKKVYKDGWVDGRKVSIHYFQHESGVVFDVKTKAGWSNSK